LNDTRDLRDSARAIFDDALRAVDARRAVLEAVRVEGRGLQVFGERFDPRERHAKIYSVALGKAAAAMASALEERLGDSLAGGVLSAPPSDVKPSKLWRVFEGGHPLPNSSSLEAARAAFELLDEADASSSLVVFLISGGGSAMLEWPRDAAVTLEDLREANRVLVSCGAAIDEVNAVRRVLSAVKGGGLSLRAPHASQLTLVVSDVRRGREHDVASGPTLAPDGDSPEAREVVARFGLDSKLPRSVRHLLLEEVAPRETDDARESSRGQHASRSHYVLLDNDSACYVLLDNDSACEAALESARARGFAFGFARDVCEQPVGEGAALLVSRLFELYAREGEGRRVCLVSGGEFACPVRGSGVGGRNSETALRCAFEIEKALRGRNAGASPRRVVALCAGTDGVDGNSLAAGAIACDSTLRRADARALDAAKSLEESDACTFFESLGDAIHTGPTGTNVRDLRILLAE
jgi:hydroxypyruvate reductase